VGALGIVTNKGNNFAPELPRFALKKSSTKNSLLQWSYGHRVNRHLMVDTLITVITSCMALCSGLFFIKAFYHRKKARSNFKEGNDSPWISDAVLLFPNLFNETGKYHRKKFFQSIAGFVLPLAVVLITALIAKVHFGIEI